VQARPIYAAAPCQENAEGVETSREALLVGVRQGPGVESLGKTSGSGQRLGAWAASEEEPKPTRGSPETVYVFLGGPESEDPVAQSERTKGMRGALKQ